MNSYLLLLEEKRHRAHKLTSSIPCRENELATICVFVEEKLYDGTWRVSCNGKGVPKIHFKCPYNLSLSRVCPVPTHICAHIHTPHYMYPILV